MEREGLEANKDEGQNHVRIYVGNSNLRFTQGMHKVSLSHGT